MSEAELIKKVAVLEVLVEGIRKDIDRVEKNFDSISSDLSLYKEDLRSVILQFKGVMSQISDYSVQIKEIEAKLRLSDDRLDDCEQDRKSSDLIRFVKDNPAKSLQITLIVLVFIFSYIFVSAPLKAILLKLLGMG